MKTTTLDNVRVFKWTTLAVLFLFSAVLALAPASSAQDTLTPDTSLEDGGSYVIRNARIVTVSGADIENGAVVISQGRIAAVGATVSAPAGAREIDARGLTVYPGMIDAGTNITLVEIGSGAPGTVDTNELGEMNPNAAAYWALNPHSAHLEVTRVAGVTNAVSLPSGGVVSGQAAFINLAGTSQREMALVPFAALVIDFPRVGGGGGFGGFQQAQQGITPDALQARDRRVEEIRRLLREAEAYGRAQDAYAKDPKAVPRPTTDLRLAALVPYARG